MRLLARQITHGARTLSRSLDTPRDVFFAVSELMRRHGGDHLSIPADAPLTGFELRAFSQNGEDGVLLEILRRAGEGSRYFLEFGAGDGRENSTLFLADVLGWSGLYIEGDSERAALLRDKFDGTAVRTLCAMVTPDTVDNVLTEAGVPVEPDVLSIDVDGADYWIWRAMHHHRPRVVVIEYNASLGSRNAMVQPAKRHDRFDLTAYGGASIAALRDLGESKGYRLVHTELTGNNAFFVRYDQPGTYPSASAVPLRSANHYLAGAGHRPDESGRPYVTPRGVA